MKLFCKPALQQEFVIFVLVQDFAAPSKISQGGIRVNLTPKMRQSLLNVTPRSQMMPNFTFPLHKYDSKKRLNRQQVLLRLAPTLVKVNDLTPLRQEFSNSALKIFGVKYTDSTLEDKIQTMLKSNCERTICIERRQPGLICIYI